MSDTDRVVMYTKSSCNELPLLQDTKRNSLGEVCTIISTYLLVDRNLDRMDDRIFVEVRENAGENFTAIINRYC